MFPYTGRS